MLKTIELLNIFVGTVTFVSGLFDEYMLLRRAFIWNRSLP